MSWLLDLFNVGASFQLSLIILCKLLFGVSTFIQQWCIKLTKNDSKNVYNVTHVLFQINAVLFLAFSSLLFIKSKNIYYGFHKNDAENSASS